MRVIVVANDTTMLQALCLGRLSLYMISVPPKGRVSMLPQFADGETEAQRSPSHKVMQLESKGARFTSVSAWPQNIAKPLHDCISFE